MRDALDQQETLAGMQEHVLRIWRQARPKLVASLTKGDLRTQAMAAAEDWLETEDELKSKGLSHQEAQNEAMRMFVSLPDLGETTELE